MTMPLDDLAHITDPDDELVRLWLQMADDLAGIADNLAELRALGDRNRRELRWWHWFSK